ncbi:MAG: hypothetical protein K6E81_08130 [Lachnospiraceae bacterium]|nr:hypothetical protein [Lachnospiraceae bacterium]
MQNFWDYNVWGTINLIATFLIALLFANLLKRKIRLLRISLIPTSVLGGLILLILSQIWHRATGTHLLETTFYNGNGIAASEVITYHFLALGFIATTFRPGRDKLCREREREIFDTGVTTVATYLLQGILGMGLTILIALGIKGFFPAAGILLPFGFGQGTGQALNYGTIYETDYGFVGGKTFGLTVAAVGFLVAAFGGVLHLNLLARRGLIRREDREPAAEQLSTADVQKADEIPMNGTMDKMTVQLALVFMTYFISYLLIFALGNLVGGLKSVLYGFNFLIGVLVATLITVLLGKSRKFGLVHREYINPFLMKRISGFCFDLMIVAGIAAIRMEVVLKYLPVLILICAVGALVTYFYLYFVARKLFPAYAEQEFMMMFGMLTGTASTGMVLLREVDRNLESAAVENIVYQNIPAMIFGFPLMLLATLAPKEPVLTLVIFVLFFAVMNVILFRRSIFRKTTTS